MVQHHRHRVLWFRDDSLPANETPALYLVAFPGSGFEVLKTFRFRPSPVLPFPPIRDSSRQEAFFGFGQGSHTRWA